MKAADFSVVAEAHRAAQGHLGFFNKMMEAREARFATGEVKRPPQVPMQKSSPKTKQ